jgi:hypothetical protein
MEHRGFACTIRGRMATIDVLLLSTIRGISRAVALGINLSAVNSFALKRPDHGGYWASQWPWELVVCHSEVPRMTSSASRF